MDVPTIVAASMRADSHRLESISQNLANVTTSGYKRSVHAGGGFESQLLRAATGLATANHLDMAAGALRATGRHQDVTIEGPGYFEVRMPEGGLAYTRNLQLQVDRDGRVTTSGWPLSADMSAAAGPLAVDSQGEVRQADRTIGQLKLVDFAPGTSMDSVGTGMFVLRQANAETSIATGQVRVGFQEASNVNSPLEMVRMTETLRHFESMQKVMQGHDEVIGKALQKLGEF